MGTFADRLQRDRIAWEDDFLTPAECRELVEELDFALWRPSTVVSRSKGGLITPFLSPRRTSESTTQYWFPDNLQSRVGVIESAICAALAVDASRLEQWQALRYGYRRGFEKHHDAGLFGSEPAGERTTTLLLYVHTPDEGGSTWFPHLHRSVAARAGRLLAWQNLARNGRPDPAMEHAGRPVRKGRKIALTTWVRERSARTVTT
jgi:prolyl 4-hydroxylase